MPHGAVPTKASPSKGGVLHRSLILKGSPRQREKACGVNFIRLSPAKGAPVLAPPRKGSLVLEPRSGS